MLPGLFTIICRVRPEVDRWPLGQALASDLERIPTIRFRSRRSAFLASKTIYGLSRRYSGIIWKPRLSSRSLPYAHFLHVPTDAPLGGTRDFALQEANP